MFVDPVFAESPFPWLFENTIQQAELITYCDPDAKKYFTSIAKNPEKKQLIRELLISTDQNDLFLSRLRSALGSNLIEINLPEREDNQDIEAILSTIKELYIPIMIDEIKEFNEAIN